jgi:hypothetical protein
MDQEAIQTEIDALGDYLDGCKMPNAVIVAFAVVGPLLVENEAISRYIVETDNLGLRAAMPGLVTVDEAVAISVAEWRLDHDQAAILADLLTLLNDSPGRLSSLERELSAARVGRVIENLLNRTS